MIETFLQTAVTTTACVAAIAGLIALFATKGGVVHRQAGTWFTRTVLFTGAVIAPLAAWYDNTFLVAAVLFAVYAAWSGRRAARRFGSQQPPDTRDRNGVLLIALTTVSLVTRGVIAPGADAPPERGMLMLGFAALLAYAGYAEHRRLRDEASAPPIERLTFHIAAMAVAWAVTTTALGATYAADVGIPAMVAWVGPTLFAVPVTLRWQAQVRAHGASATFL